MMFLFNRVPRFVLYDHTQQYSDSHLGSIFSGVHVPCAVTNHFPTASNSGSAPAPSGAMAMTTKKLLSRGMKGGKPCWVLLGLWFPWFSHDVSNMFKLDIDAMEYDWHWLTTIMSWPWHTMASLGISAHRPGGLQELPPVATCEGHGQSEWSAIACKGLYFHAMRKNRISVGKSPIGCEGFHTNLKIPSPLPTN